MNYVKKNLFGKVVEYATGASSSRSNVNVRVNTSENTRVVCTADCMLRDSGNGDVFNCNVKQIIVNEEGVCIMFTPRESE